MEGRLKKCKKTFGKCRKFEDAAITTIMSCNTDTRKLTEKETTHKRNENSVRAAMAKVQALAASGGTRTASNCKEVVLVVINL